MKRKTEDGREIYLSSLITKKLRKSKSVIITGKKWFDKINGNTYHSTSVIVDGVLIGCSGMVYGYGSQWEQTGAEILIEKGYIRGVKEKNGYVRGVRSDNGQSLSHSALFEYRTKNENRAKFNYIDCGFGLKRDLPKKA